MATTLAPAACIECPDPVIELGEEGSPGGRSRTAWCGRHIPAWLLKPGVRGMVIQDYTAVALVMSRYGTARP
jgi:hypothetical protein